MAVSEGWASCFLIAGSMTYWVTAQLAAGAAISAMMAGISRALEA